MCLSLPRYPADVLATIMTSGRRDALVPSVVAIEKWAAFGTAVYLRYLLLLYLFAPHLLFTALPDLVLAGPDPAAPAFQARVLPRHFPVDGQLSRPQVLDHPDHLEDPAIPVQLARITPTHSALLYSQQPLVSMMKSVLG